MHQHRTYVLLFLLAGLLALLVGCGTAPVPQDTDAVATAVEATLTAVAEAAAPQDTPTTAEATPAAEATAGPAAPTPEQAGAETPESTDTDSTGGQPLVLPPKLANFDPAERPLATKGESDAPIVMYEWSDYT